MIRRLKRFLMAAAVLSTCGVLLMAAGWLLSPFPVKRLERWPASPLVTDRHGREMLRVVGDDEQWRFVVPLERISPQLIQATIAVEDERFLLHGGIDPPAVLRAIGQNLGSLRVVSGASTLTMQICRMLDDRPRTFAAKMIEALRALQLESIYSKQQILQTYLNIAPYGHNIRGVEAAARAYFGKSAEQLSLGEAALLAGLPQSPNRLRPDRSPEKARARREIVLRRMAELGMIDDQQLALASSEPIPTTLCKAPKAAPHAAWMSLQRRLGGGRTTLDLSLQSEMERIAARHRLKLPPGCDVAMVVIDIPSGDILAMVGSADANHTRHGQVNGCTARRSPGSTLKPFIYAAAFEERLLSPQSVVHDIPIERAGWSPSNFDKTFAGDLPVADALRRSLNVPAIMVAEGVGLPRCLGLIEAAGVRLPANTLARGGLAVVVGSVEITLLDLTNAYATIGRGGVRRSPRLLMDDPTDESPAIEANVCAAIDEILSSRVRRPQSMAEWPAHQVPWFAWKTGTSSGRRDAWAVGHNRRFAAGVWAGLFSGAGESRLVGAGVAEPLLADIFALPAIRTDKDPLPARPWIVERPLPPPRELGEELAITSPRNGATFLAMSGQAVIHPRVNRKENMTWFLNGRLIGDSAKRLILTPGQYELRCVDASGKYSAVEFTVR
ncbi:MAG TPA: penicillin-binding protein 1C [Phycisphaerae bacterium]|nr:penicillin-binding protein 1C [Phycisphaerae bacterium]HRY70810.1 penicillin-binding protein 1C [Phycisphaerae bacterium]HSA28315.1 penicillin-binding protein 1C [Phycisphaerae bacterium]